MEEDRGEVTVRRGSNQRVRVRSSSRRNRRTEEEEEEREREQEQSQVEASDHEDGEIEDKEEEEEDDEPKQRKQRQKAKKKEKEDEDEEPKQKKQKKKDEEEEEESCESDHEEETNNEKQPTADPVASTAPVPAPAAANPAAPQTTDAPVSANGVLVTVAELDQDMDKFKAALVVQTQSTEVIPDPNINLDQTYPDYFANRWDKYECVVPPRVRLTLADSQKQTKDSVIVQDYTFTTPFMAAGFSSCNPFGDFGSQGKFAPLSLVQAKASIQLTDAATGIPGADDTRMGRNTTSAKLFAFINALEKQIIIECMDPNKVPQGKSHILKNAFMEVREKLNQAMQDDKQVILTKIGSEKRAPTNEEQAILEQKSPSKEKLLEEFSQLFEPVVKNKPEGQSCSISTRVFFKLSTEEAAMVEREGAEKAYEMIYGPDFPKDKLILVGLMTGYKYTIIPWVSADGHVLEWSRKRRLQHGCTVAAKVGVRVYLDSPQGRKFGVQLTLQGLIVYNDKRDASRLILVPPVPIPNAPAITFGEEDAVPDNIDQLPPGTLFKAITAGGGEDSTGGNSSSSSSSTALVPVNRPRSGR